MSWTNISKVLSNVKNRPGIKKKFQMEVFRKIVQNQIGLSDAQLKNIKNLSFQNGKLIIKINSSLLAQEFFLKKENLKKEINKYSKKEEVNEIIVKKA